MARLGPPDLSARELQAVVTVAQCNSFIAAALTLNLSQPALTRIIQRVERALGVGLFKRSTRRVEVTAEGREFAVVAERVLNDLRISTRRMQEKSKEVRGQIIVSSVMSLAHTALPAIVKVYRKKRPRVEVHVREGVHGSVLQDVRGATLTMIQGPSWEDAVLSRTGGPPTTIAITFSPNLAEGSAEQRRCSFPAALCRSARLSFD
ncbi:MAG: LysR family transcriptional regulator [Burkholderiales bacterium]